MRWLETLAFITLISWTALIAILAFAYPIHFTQEILCDWQWSGQDYCRILKFEWLTVSVLILALATLGLLLSQTVLKSTSIQ